MKITREGRPVPFLGLLSTDPEAPPGTDPGPDCCAIGEEPPDRAAGGDAVALTGLGVGALVQSKSSASASTAEAATFDDPVTAGNLIIIAANARNGGRTPTPPAGFTQIQSTVTVGSFFIDSLALFYKVASGAETTLAVSWSGSGGTIIVISEWSGMDPTPQDSDTATGTDTSCEAGTVTPLSDKALIYAALDQSGADTTRSMTPGSGYTELADLQLPVGPAHPNAVSIYQLDETASGGYSPVATCDNVDHGGISAAWGYATDPAWNLPAPNVTDADDATYETIAGASVLRIDLGAAFRIVASHLRIATATAGSRTYTITGANLPDFSDGVVLSSVTFTALGSNSPQDVEFLWTTDAAYRYFQLDGNNETRRIHTWELREETPGSLVVTDPTTSQSSSLQEALNNIYAAAGAGNFLKVVDGGGDTVQDHGNTSTTETVDPAAGNIHFLTLNADCAITLTAPTSGPMCTIEIFLTQDGTGSRTVTWPGSVAWPGGAAPTLSTTAGATDRVILETRDGGTTWYGVMVGSGGSSSSPTFVGVRVYNSADFSHNSSGNFLNITFDTENYDSDGFHDTGSNTDRLTVPTGLGGKYHIFGCAEWDTSVSGGDRAHRLLVNGTTEIAWVRFAPFNQGSSAVIDTTYALAQTDYVTFGVFQSSGGTRLIEQRGQASPSFGMERIGV